MPQKPVGVDSDASMTKMRVAIGQSLMLLQPKTNAEQFEGVRSTNASISRLRCLVLLSRGVYPQRIGARVFQKLPKAARLVESGTFGPDSQFKAPNIFQWKTGQYYGCAHVEVPLSMFIMPPKLAGQTAITREP